MRNKVVTFINRRKWWLVVLVVVALLGGLIWRARQPKPVVLKFEKPSVGTITKTLEVSGFVDAKEKARLRFLAGGKLTYLGAKEGDLVKKGQVIAGIDKATLQKQLQQDLNTYMQERWDWDQTLDNTKDRWLPKSEARDKDQSQWTLDNKVLDVEIQDIAIKNSNISAPFSGVLVTAPTAVAGVQLAATDYFDIVNPSSLVFKAPVDEVDIKDVAVGQPAQVSLDSYPGEPIQTNIGYISHVSSKTESGTAFVIELALPSDNNLSKLRLGMNGDVTITLVTKDNVLSIPLAATRTRDNKTYIDVKTGANTYSEREIQVGIETDERVEVKSGLNADEEILIPNE